jgi:acyl carrier protein
MDGTGDPRSLAALREWLTLRVAGYLDGPADRIRSDVSFAECGLDSMYALMLCGDIEDHFGIPIEPRVAWDNRTIDALAGYLAGQLGYAQL